MTAWCRTCDQYHLQRVWCVAPGCRWAGYRTDQRHGRKVEEHRSEAQLTAGTCPRCGQHSVRRYPPRRRLTGEHLLPGLPNSPDDYLLEVDGPGIVAARRAARAAIAVVAPC